MTTTPPHQPTYNIKFTSSKISHIISCAFPNRKVESIDQLESGRSFNNRIYFLKFAATGGQTRKNAVLKVSGQFFGADKIQNEVANLCLLERYCPMVPAPRVLAWCDSGIEGDKLQVLDRSKDRKPDKFPDIVTFVHPQNDRGSSEIGWILLDQRPGRPLDCSDIAGQAGEEVMKELASFVAQIRKAMPTADRIGNLIISSISPASREPSSYSDFFNTETKIEIKGLLNCTHSPAKPIFSASQYYHSKLQDQLTKLNTEEAFTTNRPEVNAAVQSFISEDFPKLQLLKQPHLPTFTHNDFSPRNILVTGSPPSITAILDFEFAGFFPPEEEFANNAVCNDGDWPPGAYEVFLSELENLGIRTPLNGFPERSWRQARILMELTENVAPWFLREQEGIPKEDVQKECRKAEDRVRKCIRELQESVAGEGG